ncbi:hypothetical protein AGMMS49928_29580 [Spirochaetia bacterium]|nr:hypothetical protein AGMMS49928_29580 [Spirochaetia bacterium]
MIEKGKGGANTLTGKAGSEVFFNQKLVARCFKKHEFYKYLELKVEYVYALNNWFKKPVYKDVLDYINSVNCHYKFNELPLAWLGLPTGSTK